MSENLQLISRTFDSQKLEAILMSEFITQYCIINVKEALCEYPSLKREDIYACIQYASKLMANRYEVQEIANGFLIDENLPINIEFSPTLPVEHVTSLKSSPTDTEIWEYAKKNNLVIVTKDADFSDV